MTDFPSQPMTATPTPWVAEPEYEDGPPNFIHKEGHAIADCNMGNGAEDDANAALIVEAVNNYASLKARISEFESNERAYEDRIKELEAQLEHALRQWLIC